MADSEGWSVRKRSCRASTTRRNSASDSAQPAVNRLRYSSARPVESPATLRAHVRLAVPTASIVRKLRVLVDASLDLHGPSTRFRFGKLYTPACHIVLVAASGIQPSDCSGGRRERQNLYELTAFSPAVSSARIGCSHLCDLLPLRSYRLRGTVHRSSRL